MAFRIPLYWFIPIFGKYYTCFAIFFEIFFHVWRIALIFSNFGAMFFFKKIGFRGLILLFWFPFSVSVAQEDLQTALEKLQKAGNILSAQGTENVEELCVSASGSFRYREQWDHYLECRILLAQYYERIADLEGCRELLDESFDLYHSGRVTSDSLKPRLWYIESRYFRQSGRPDRALEKLDRVISQLEATGSDQNLLSRGYNYAGLIYLDRMDYKRARQYFDRSYRMARQLTEGPSLLREWYFHNISLVERGLGNMRKALQDLRKSLDMTVRLKGEDHPETAQSYVAYADLLMNNLMTDSALYYLERAEEIWIRHYGREHPYLSSVYVEYSDVYYIMGDHASASNYLRKAIELIRKCYGPRHIELISKYRTIGNIYMVRERYREALAYFRRADSIMQHNRSAQINYLHASVAYCYDRMGKADSARYYFERFMDQLSTGEDISNKTVLYMRAYADFLRVQGPAKQSRQIHERLLDHAERQEAGNPFTAALLYYTYAQYLKETDRSEQALHTFNKVIGILNPEFNPEDVLDVPEEQPVMFWRNYYYSLLHKAALSIELASRQDDRERQEEYFLSTLGTVDHLLDIKSGLYALMHNDESRLMFGNDLKKVYEAGIEASFQMYRVTGLEDYARGCFEYSEKSRYALLRANMEKDAKIRFRRLPDNLEENESGVLREIASIRQRIRELENEGRLSDPQVAFWNELIFEKQLELESIKKQIQKFDPAYYNLKYEQKVTDPLYISKQLDQGERLVEYFLGDRYCTIFDISKDTFMIHRAGVDSSFYKDIENIRQYVQYDYFNEEKAMTFKDFAGSSGRLYTGLIAPLDIPGGHSLIIIPDVHFAGIPFDVLLTGAAKGLDANLPWLIRDHDISYAFSASLLFRDEKARGRVKRKVLAFAPHASDVQEADMVYSRSLEIDRDSLKSLPMTGREAWEVQDLFGGRVYLNGEASEYIFKRKAGRYSLLHLAMHALIDAEDPLYSQLVFSDDTSGGQDGFLNVYEIYDLNLNAEMVVLSACNTGTGKLYHGEGIISLARAFAYAGVPSVTMTLWKIPDETSYELTLRYYGYLKQGFDKAAAMRRAKLDYLERKDPFAAHPAVWSSYLVVGDKSSLETSKQKYWILVLLGLMIVSGIWQFGKRFYKKG